MKFYFYVVCFIYVILCFFFLGEKPYTCRFCSRQFAQQSNMQKHELLHQGIKPFSCNMCKASFTQQSNLKKHLETHSNINRIRNRKTYECEKCNRSYSTKSSLCKHMRKCLEDDSKRMAIASSNKRAFIDVCSGENKASTVNQFLDEFGYVIRRS